ncbi:hypothetical protein Pint_36226 [Pistacia integerrima]|uniref:Uncharacterized protein n=1 Tax=Pistacia integerrima TaxID=434235 RepID=A0ACC0Y417_9ROSI|nr:hypothetical protein Pint_36226 [Pistacia integerrima]
MQSASMDPEMNINPGDDAFRDDCIPVVFVAAIYFGFFFISFLGGSNDHPQIEVNSVSIDNFSVSVSESQLTGNWSVILSIKNPYKDEIISYSSFELHVSYKKEFISGRMVINGFEQAAGQENLFAAGFSLSSAPISSQSARRVEDELIGSRVIEFEVMIHGRIKRFANEGSRSRAMHYKISGSCENLKVGFGSNSTVGIILNSPSHCKVRSRRAAS